MSTYILTSMFNNGFNDITTEVLKKKITQRNGFAFIASDFEMRPRKIKKYFEENL